MNVKGTDDNHKVCALLGFPAKHSLGSTVHNAAFAELGLPFVYVANDVPPADLPAAFAEARALGYRGLSITMPHKVAAMGLVDEVDPMAQAIGCINTVVNENGRLIGYNFDGQGALSALERAGIDTRDRRVLVLGSGGAARAIAMTLAMRGGIVRLVILANNKNELSALSLDIAENSAVRPIAHVLDESSLEKAVGDTDLIMNCTPVGMNPDTEHSLVPHHLLRLELAVFDVVYNPRQTLLLREAAAAGCRVVSGIEMFLDQAIAQFELWTGHLAPEAVMRRVTEERR